MAGLGRPRRLDGPVAGAALLVLAGQTLGRESGIILNFDVLVQRKLAEATGAGRGGAP